jgi:hypothetical protein
MVADNAKFRSVFIYLRALDGHRARPPDLTPSDVNQTNDGERVKLEPQPRQSRKGDGRSDLLNALLYSYQNQIIHYS